MPDANNHLTLARKTVAAHLTRLGITDKEEAARLAEEQAAPALFSNGDSVEVRRAGVPGTGDLEEQLALLARLIYVGAPGYLKREADPLTDDRIAAKAASGHVDYSL